MIAALILAAATCHYTVLAGGALGPDPKCTPGLPRPLSKEQVCTVKWGKDERHVTQAMKDQVFASYGVATHTRTSHEIDHLVSRELGGADDVRNLFPQPAAPVPGFHQKDHCENLAHVAVCSGKITLKAAQEGIAKDWLSFCQSIGALK